jgi:hypothetical protein
VMGRPMPAGTGLFVSTTVDIHGRLADRSPLRRLGWDRGIARVLPRRGGPGRHRDVGIWRERQRDGTGHPRLPSTLRHRCRLSPGDRILVVVVHGLDRMEIYTPRGRDHAAGLPPVLARVPGMNDELAAARLLLARLGIEPEQLLSASTRGVPIPTVGAYLRNVAEAAPPGTRRVYHTYWARVAAAWGDHWARRRTRGVRVR